MDILFYGGHYWEKGPWFRKQQFASRLAQKGHRVFYIQSSPSIVRRSNSENKYFKTSIKELNENLYLVYPSRLFPKPSNYYSRSLFNQKLYYDLRYILKKMNIKDFILWFNQTEFGTVLNKLNCFKIFDLADDRPFYLKLANDENGYKTYMKYLEKSFKFSDASVVSAIKIKEKYSYLFDKDIDVIPNGHNIKTNGSFYDCPKEIKELDGPKIGFLGTLFRFIDEDLLAYIIKERPNYNYIFVGPTDSSFNIQKIKSYDNVYLLGPKSKEQVKNYINSFDLCLNPFRVHEVNDSVNPVKVFEYLSLNKRVVSTEMYSLKKEKIADYIDFAESSDKFLEKIDAIISSQKLNNSIPKELVNEYHWDSLFEKLITQLNKKYNLNL